MVKAVLDDLTTLPAKRREKRLETLAEEALPCRAVTVFDGNPDDGIAVALRVGSRRRGDVLDLARVVEDDARVHGTCDWSLIPPAGRRNYSRLLLRVGFERPVHCDYTVSLDVRNQASDPLRAALPLLLAASRLVFIVDGQVDRERPLVWIDAPIAREPILELLTAVGVC
jgi:hypothetical protein